MIFLSKIAYRGARRGCPGVRVHTPGHPGHPPSPRAPGLRGVSHDRDTPKSQVTCLMILGVSRGVPIMGHPPFRQCPVIMGHP
jgi:hypothetical protein